MFLIVDEYDSFANKALVTYVQHSQNLTRKQPRPIAEILDFEEPVLQTSGALSTNKQQHTNVQRQQVNTLIASAPANNPPPKRAKKDQRYDSSPLVLMGQQKDHN